MGFNGTMASSQTFLSSTFSLVSTLVRHGISTILSNALVLHSASGVMDPEAPLAVLAAASNGVSTHTPFIIIILESGMHDYWIQ